MDLLGELDLVDPFRLLHGRKGELIWQGIDGGSGSSLDRFCMPE